MTTIEQHNTQEPAAPPGPSPPHTDWSTLRPSDRPAATASRRLNTPFTDPLATSTGPAHKDRAQQRNPE